MAEPFHIDLADPVDIQAKMPEIKALYAERRAALVALQAQVDMLARIVGDRSALAASRASRRAPKPYITLPAGLA